MILHQCQVALKYFHYNYILQTYKNNIKRLTKLTTFVTKSIHA
jgi:hypothetical protein